MNITLASGSIFLTKADHIILFYSSLKSLQYSVKNSPLESFIDHMQHNGHLKDSTFSQTKQTITLQSKLVDVYLINPGTKDTHNTFRHAIATAARSIQNKQTPSVAVGFDQTATQHMLLQCIEGIVLGQYSFQTFKSKPKSTKTITNWQFHTTTFKNIDQLITQAKANAEGQNMARQLANTPANKLTPQDVVTTVKQSFATLPVDINVITQKDALKQKMGAFLAVGQGSSCDSFILELTLNKSKKSPIILVGKGVTFDTGGISLKPGRSMSDMKGDMSGAAAVIGAMHALAQQQCNHHVKAIIPLVENMPAGNAYKPGDVITAMNGKTIEVINTDAEGRLILADALCLAATYNPKLIVDIATLTGACSVALGDVASAVLGNSQQPIDVLMSTHEKTGEYFWQLPLYDQYKDYLKSTTADLLNCAENRLAGTATAAIFLQEFVDKKTWIHLDIASTMQHSKTAGFNIKGMSGTATRSLIQLVLNS